MKEFKTKEEYEEASSMLVGCDLLIVCIYFIYAAKLNMHKAKKADKKEQDDD